MYLVISSFSYFFVTSKELSTATVREVRLVCEPPADSVSEDNSFSLNIGEIKVCVSKIFIFIKIINCHDIGFSIITQTYYIFTL